MPKSDVQRIGSSVFDPGTGTVRAADRTETVLRPQTRHVLRTLLEARGELVAKDRLMEAVWPDTHVTDDSLVQCVSEIRKALGPEDGALLKTVPRKGYRLDAGSDPRAERFAARLSGPGRLAALAVVAAMVIALTAWLALRPPPGVSAGRSLAVLPLANIAEDDTYRYFANGITEDLVVSLSGVPDLRVASRGAAMAAAEDSEDPRDIARALAVDYVVEGSIRRRRDSLRLTVSLVDGKTGENTWANSYEGSLGDIFAFQDAVLEELFRVLAVRLSPAERNRLGIYGTDDAVAYDHYLRGRELQNFLTPTANLDSEAAFREAIHLDPEYAAAHAYLSLVLSNGAEYGWAGETRRAVEQAVAHADRAVELDPELPFALFARGRLRSRQFVGDMEGALADFREAIALDPNYHDAHAFVANVLVFTGQPAEARETILRAMDRNPNPPYWYFIPLGTSNYYLGDYEAAEAALLTVLERNPNSPHAMRNLIATYGRMGRTEDAAWYAYEYESLGLEATISAIVSSSAKQDARQIEAFVEGLRLAGLPE